MATINVDVGHGFKFSREQMENFKKAFFDVPGIFTGEVVDGVISTPKFEKIKVRTIRSL